MPSRYNQDFHASDIAKVSRKLFRRRYRWIKSFRMVSDMALIKLFRFCGCSSVSSAIPIRERNLPVLLFNGLTTALVGTVDRRSTVYGCSGGDGAHISRNGALAGAVRVAKCLRIPIDLTEPDFGGDLSRGLNLWIGLHVLKL